MLKIAAIAAKPFRMLVSVVTPTCNRRRFIPALIECFRHQDYPITEWIVLDDGTDKVRDLFNKSGLNVRYYEDTKRSIGAKRNKLNELAKGDIIVCMDDDDYYPPERVSHVVQALSKGVLCGSSEIYVYYSDTAQIYKMGPYSEGHATNGTLAYRRSYLETHRHDDVCKAEEASFLNGFTEPMIQLDPFKTQLLMSHSENTFDKRTIRGSPMAALTPFTLERFIPNAELRSCYTATPTAAAAASTATL
jgi:glycosyltransferase involved in cell wall biosynthesis